MTLATWNGLKTLSALALGGLVLVAPPAGAGSDGSQDAGASVGTGLLLPRMDAEEGRKLFASKGCVVCHAVNDVGGEDAPMLDAEFMDSPMNPFDFAANMWRGAEAMVSLQREELGDVIDLTGAELDNIIAFVHDPAQQALFSEEDIPEDIKELIEHAEEEEEPHD